MIQNPYKPTLVFDGADMTGDLTSDAIDIIGFYSIGLQFNWTGTPTGTIAIKLSAVNDITTAQSLTLTGLTPAFTQPAGTAASQRIDLDGINSGFAWVTYTHSSGAGAMTAYVVANA